MDVLPTFEEAAGARLGMPAGHAERAAYVVRGRVEVAGRSLAAGRIALPHHDGEAFVPLPEPAIPPAG